MRGGRPTPPRSQTIDWHRYPDRDATAVRAALAAHHGVDPAQVFVANGSNEVLQTVLLTYGGAGRTALRSGSRPTRCTRTSAS